MAQLWILVFGVLGLSCSACGQNSTNKYENYSLLRIFANNESQLESIYKFKDPEDKIEILKHSHGLNDSLDVLVPPNRLDYIFNFTKGMIVEQKSQNYGRNIFDLQQQPKTRRALRAGDEVFEYKSAAEINEFIEAIARAHPKEVEVVKVGNSFEGREMKLVKISSNQKVGNPVIFIDGGIHAREWAAPAMALYIIHRLTNDRHADLDGVDWYILPLVNPDGYEYSRSDQSNRMWRKTRSKSARATCLGVDGNRNYGFKWAVSGVSMNPCDKETYAGPKPFSEPETRIVRNIMMDNRDRIKLYVSLHSYGQYLVYPWGYTGDFLPKTWKKLDNLARLVSSSVERAGGLPFKVLSAGKWYAAAGGSDDFAFGAAGVPYSYTMEITDGYEFMYPESKLEGTFPQLYEGFKTFGREIKRQFGQRRRHP